MYKIDTRVRYSECGKDGKLKLASLINYFQDCSSAHSETLGIGMEYLKQKKRVWVLNSWQIVIERFPKVHEAVEVSTWPTGFKGVFGPRNFCMKTQGGEMLAYANTLWVYMDTEKGVPTKPDDYEKEIYGTEPPLEMAYAPRKINVPKEKVVVDRVTVCKYHIDTNQHMNNAQYVQLAAEVLPEEFAAREIRVEYKKSAVCGDRIVLKKAEEADGEKKNIIVEMCGDEDAVYAVVKFMS